MPSFGQALRQSRESAGLSLDEFARLSGLPVASLEDWERGTPAEAASMDRCALVMGVRLTDFLQGEGERADVALLFRRTREASLEAARQQVLTLDTDLGLSRFCRAVYELRDLRAKLGLSPFTPPAELASAYDARPRGGNNAGDHLARAARRALSLDPAVPVPSMRALLDTLGIPLVIAGRGEVDAQIAGASVLHPLPAMLLVPVWNSTWVTRMTLAHELCHVLFHGQGFSVSTSQADEAQPRWNLDADYAGREQEANAFAAAFLAPTLAVQQLLQGSRPDSEQGVKRVGAHFRVGKGVAINRIVDIYGLPESRRQALLGLRVQWPPGDGDVLQDEETGLLQGQVRSLAFEAFSRGLITKTRVRSILQLPDAEPLEGEALPEALRAPVLGKEASAVRRCQFELLTRGSPLIAETPAAQAGGFRVTLTTPAGAQVGHVDVDGEGHLLGEPVLD